MAPGFRADEIVGAAAAATASTGLAVHRRSPTAEVDSTELPTAGGLGAQPRVGAAEAGARIHLPSGPVAACVGARRGR